MIVGGCGSSVAEHWRLKPEALGSIPDSTTSLSLPLPFQKSLDSNGPDYLSLDDLYWSSDLGEPCPLLCLDYFKITTHTHSNYRLSTIYTYIYINIYILFLVFADHL